MTFWAFVLFVLLVLYLKYEFKFDYTSDKKLLIWYNEDGYRTYKILLQF